MQSTSVPLRLILENHLRLYEQCVAYLNTHEEDFSLKEPVLLGYALALSENGESAKGLEIIQKLLFSDISGKTDYSATENPGIALIEPVQ